MFYLCKPKINEKNMEFLDTNTNELQTVERRIREIMNSEGLTQQDFAQRLGISPGSLSNIFNGRTRATNNHTMAIHRAFPNLNIEWLLFGEGSMYAKQSADQKENPNASVDRPSSVGDKQSLDGLRGIAADGPLSLFDVEDATSSPIAQTVNNKQYLSTDEYIKKIDIKQRSIKEIRVFYDDGTYESFVKQ